jgi:hypothetical protein
MEKWQHDFVFIYSIWAMIFSLKGLYESAVKKNPYGQQTYWINLYGAFVWGDMVVLGLFWFLGGMIIWYLNDWNLFLLTLSIFWLIRSLGETLYWFLVQFSQKVTDPPERFYLSKFFPGNSIWFIHQLFWQCISVTTLILTIYFTNQWLSH